MQMLVLMRRCHLCVATKLRAQSEGKINLHIGCATEKIVHSAESSSTHMHTDH